MKITIKAGRIIVTRVINGSREFMSSRGRVLSFANIDKARQFVKHHGMNPDHFEFAEVKNDAIWETENENVHQEGNGTSASESGR